MKKIVLGIAAVAMAASMAFADPAANVSVTEFNGNATVKWGIDLDSKKTGFENSTWTKIKLNLFDAGDKSTSGDGIWGELKLITKETYNPMAYTAGENAAPSGWTFQVPTIDTAKIHFGDSFYVGILAGDTTVGQFKVVRALNGDAELLSDVSTASNYTQGIVAGYSDGNFGVDVDFRTKAHYTNEYGMAAEVTFKDSNEWVSGLGAKAGVTYEFVKDGIVAYMGNASYKLPITGAYYVKPSVGYTGSTNNESKIAASVVFGWGDQGWGNPGVYFIDSDMNKTPGVSVDYVKDLKSSSDLGTIYAAFYLGDLVANAKAAADLKVVLTDGADPVITAKAGAAYDIKADDLTITPKAGASYAKDNLLVKAGVDLNGLVDNTTFGIEYVSGNLLADPAVIGAINLSAQIHF